VSAVPVPGIGSKPAVGAREEARHAFVAAARDRLGAALVGYHDSRDGAVCLITPASGYRAAAEFIRSQGIDRFDFLTCVDWPAHFTLTLQAYSFETKLVTRLSIRIPRDDFAVPTITDLWFLADWEEREVFDLFGLNFAGHPDLKRILNPETWVGHPLRKDYADHVDIKRPEYF